MLLVATTHQGHALIALMLMLVLAVIIAVKRLVLFGPGRGSVRRSRRDPRRRFNSAERRLILARADNRCEGVYLGVRCRRMTNLQADHVLPWAAGGLTTVENGQALCRACNREKSNRVPSRRQVRRLAERRERY